MDNRPIGFFDSGIGGLTCIPHFIEGLPKERVIYFGDTARVPYSSRTFSVIREFSIQIADFLVKQDVKMIVIACNTATVASIDVIRKKYPNIPIIGIMDKAIEEITQTCSEEQKIGVIATKTTIASGIYERRIKSLNSELSVFSIACQAFAMLIEEGIMDRDIMNLVIKHYLDDFIKQNEIDTLVLGCTHYPLIRKNIEELYPHVCIVDPSKEVIFQIKSELELRNMSAKTPKFENVFYASDLTDSFKKMLASIFGDKEVEIRLKNFEGDMLTYDT